MAAVEIPIKPGSGQSLRVSLAGQTYDLTVRWNTFSACWMLDAVLTSTGAALFSGVPLVTGADLLRQLGYLGIGGQLGVVSDQNADAVPTFASLGVQGHLIFQT